MNALIKIMVDPCAAILVFVVTGLLCVGIKESTFVQSVVTTANIFSLVQLFVYLVELWTENRRRALAHWVLNRKLTIQDLEKADLDDDKVVSAVEFIVYKLREMGKVSHEDIAIVV
ncbi:hypothetical protein L1987_47737 [Smallanthus sonchifolius]|uniref:Uncharacterized protein n=1 Tax=Smallanthus sonchifolius TaxID=185202 RepID=A0ACB9G3E5_9ASTR|nr:hypothetical protein L1987_47737 [Smallanthus sonchifolius]